MNFFKFSKRISFTRPPKVNIVIYYESFYEGILCCLPKNENYFLLKKSPSVIYINSHFFMVYVKNIVRKSFLKDAMELILERGFLEGIFVYLKDIKDLTIIKLTNAKIIITRICYL